MAGLLYVRKAGGAGGSDILIADLGAIIPSGPTWICLSAFNEEEAEASSGKFTSREIRDSQDLFLLIRAGTLDWSKDGSTLELPADYVADYTLVDSFIDDNLNLASGSFVLPQGISNPVTTTIAGMFYNTSEQQLYVGTSNGWEGIEVAAPKTTLLIDEVGTFTYVGESYPGTPITASGWRIYRLDESASGAEELIKLWANNSTNFDQVWNDRLSLTYTVS